MLHGLLCGRTHRPAIIVALVMPAACVEEAPIQISDSGYGAYEVSLAPFNDGVAVAWYDTRDGNAEIYLQLLDATGAAQGNAHRLTSDTADSYEVSIDTAGDAIAVAWYDKASDERLQAHLGVWSADGGLDWRTALGRANRESRNPVVRAVDERIFCAWIELDDVGTETVRGGWWDLDGNSLGAPIDLGPASATTWNLNAAIDSAGSAYVVYDAAFETVAEELFVAQLESGAATLTRLTADDGHRSKYPDLALLDDRAALTWFDERDGNREVYLFVGAMESIREIAIEAADESREDLFAVSRRVTDTPGESIGAYVAWQFDRVGLAWTGTTRSSKEIFFQRFAANGTPLAEIEQLTQTPTSSLIPAIRRVDDGFAIAWNEVDTAGGGIHDAATRSEINFRFVR